ncbi:GNAT family N-acetyltransferase [Luteimonas sp. SJ-92]|uniref:GNAT family N-acetyltransferase n=1 Tax=Luteimonas salinisoli TaxID=2752307 RepID=A0A853JC79_9GAMM|nr:GNAT family N-acetyltransferase [Luteimonas salinisoli]NZA26831.1 GNAT family N-acetyltransferase [Luteimonas salinisoli]
MTVVVRAVTPEDVSSLLRLLRAKAQSDGVPQQLHATEDNLRTELFRSGATARAIVATIEEEVAGMATYFQTFSSFLMKPGLWLDDLYVDEARRKCGIGRELPPLRGAA